jgi:hypothetical protein
MSDEEWIVKLISNYVESARLLSRRLGEAFHQTDLLEGHRSKMIPRSGTSANGLEFRFHGIGCWISDGNISVDFDFLPDGQVGGFDAWRLHVFANENPSVVGVRSQQEVQSALDLLLKLGLIQTVESSSLYRLRAMPADRFE